MNNGILVSWISILCFSIGLVLGILLAYLIYISRKARDVAVGKEIGRKEGIIEGKGQGRLEGFEIGKAESTDDDKKIAFLEGKIEGRKEAISEFCIEVHPFYKTKTVGFPGFRKTHLQAGVTKILHVNGIPAMEPSEVILHNNLELTIDVDQLLEIAEKVTNAYLNCITPTKGIPMRVSELINRTNEI